MGLDTSHGCWSGAYSAFSRWRDKLAEVAGIPLPLMDGWYGAGDNDFLSLWLDSPQGRRLAPAMDWAAPRDGGPLCGSYHGPTLHRWITDVARWLPIKWDRFEDDPLCILLWHSDCDGEITAKQCTPLANRLEELLPLLPDDDGGGHIGPWKAKTQQFIDGLRLAASRGEAVEFH